jgi:hypothetical protein
MKYEKSIGMEQLCEIGGKNEEIPSNHHFILDNEDLRNHSG